MAHGVQALLSFIPLVAKSDSSKMYEDYRVEKHFFDIMQSDRKDNKHIENSWAKQFSNLIQFLRKVFHVFYTIIITWREITKQNISFISTLSFRFISDESIIASCSCNRFSKGEDSRRKKEKLIGNNIIVFEKRRKCIGDIVIANIVILISLDQCI